MQRMIKNCRYVLALRYSCASHTITIHHSSMGCTHNCQGATADFILADEGFLEAADKDNVPFVP